MFVGVQDEIKVDSEDFWIVVVFFWLFHVFLNFVCRDKEQVLSENNVCSNYAKMLTMISTKKIKFADEDNMDEIFFLKKGKIEMNHEEASHLLKMH